MLTVTKCTQCSMAVLDGHTCHYCSHRLWYTPHVVQSESARWRKVYITNCIWCGTEVQRTHTNKANPACVDCKNWRKMRRKEELRGILNKP